MDAARAELLRDADAFGRKLEQCETELSTAKRQAFEARMQCDATVNTARQECRELCASLEERLVQQDLDKSAAEKQKRDFEQQAIDESRKLQAELKVLTGKVARLEGDVEKIHKPKIQLLEDEKARVALDRDAHKTSGCLGGGGECGFEALWMIRIEPFGREKGRVEVC